MAIAATFVQIGWVLARGKKVTNMQWASLVIIARLRRRDAAAARRDLHQVEAHGALLDSRASRSSAALAFGKNLVKAVMSEGIELPEPVWFKLCVAWGVFFLFKGTLNLWVAYNFSTDTWVNFKLFGGMGLMLAFIIAQAVWLSRYLPDEPAPPEEKS